jgi:hypothetical protein
MAGTVNPTTHDRVSDGGVMGCGRQWAASSVIARPVPLPLSALLS